MAIPDDELARLGLSSSSNEAQEAAQLFWAGEELTDMGDGRFYPCRQASLGLTPSMCCHAGDQGTPSVPQSF